MRRYISIFVRLLVLAVLFSVAGCIVNATSSPGTISDPGNRSDSMTGNWTGTLTGTDRGVSVSGTASVDVVEYPGDITVTYSVTGSGVSLTGDASDVVEGSGGFMFNARSQAYSYRFDFDYYPTRGTMQMTVFSADRGLSISGLLSKY